MKKPEVLKPTERQVVSRRLSIKIAKVSGCAALGLAAAGGYAGRFPDWLIFALWIGTAAATAVSGYFRQGNLPPMLWGRDGEQ